MRYLFLVILFGQFGFAQPPAVYQEHSADLTIVFQNINPNEGTLRLALYDSKSSFMDESKARGYNFRVSGIKSQTHTLPDLKPGVYAIAVFQDLNDNYKLDKNLIGIPVEPYCFSKEPPSKWKPPTFDEAKFALKATGDTLWLYLKRWRL